MDEFEKYERTNIAEMRPVTEYDIETFKSHNNKLIVMVEKKVVIVSISQYDLENGSPKIGDMIARNPNKLTDMWLVAEQYFKENFRKRYEVGQKLHKAKEVELFMKKRNYPLSHTNFILNKMIG